MNEDKLIAEFMGFAYYHPHIDIDTSECGGIYERFEIFSKIPIEASEYPADDQFYFEDDWYRDNWKDVMMAPEFKTDWKWLMPVVDKIEDLGFSTMILSHADGNDGVFGMEIMTNSPEMRTNWPWGVMDNEMQDSRIGAVYDSVIKFIGWFNEYNK